jgi:RNA polymerase II subunit A-like phosphatase
MLLRFPASLHYPITVTELLKQPNDNVERFAPLFSYFYKTTVTEGDDLGNEVQVEKTFPTRFESTVEGTLVRWKIQKGAVVTNPKYVVSRQKFPCTDSYYSEEIAHIEEPCSHSVQFGGMCVNCGKDMTE